MRAPRSIRLSPAALLLSASLPAATIQVTSTADSGAGTLRQAILDSNASPGVLDTIAFSIPGAGVHTIGISTDLPNATDPVIVDGTTQPGYAGTPLVEVTMAAPSQGLRFTGGGSTVRGLSIYGFGINVGFLSVGGNTVEGCYIGTDATGTVTSSGNGIYLQNSGNATIGGAAAGSRNVLSGMSGTAISVLNADGTTIRGNLIGTDPTGLVSLGNGSSISIGNTDGVTIGGSAAGEGNVISANTATGISISGGGNVLIAGNMIGTNATGTVAMPSNFAIDANNLVGPLTIGGTDPGARNVISGNNIGIFLNNGVHDATIQNNLIGTDVTGTLPLPNTLAILLNTLDTTDVVIGGIGPGEANVIAFNAGVGNAHGIWNLGLRVTIRGNAIYSNQGLGLDNGSVGVNPNDPGDADGGANDGQNFPNVSTVEILQAPLAGTRVTGVLRSAASTTYELDFYGSTACTPRPQDFLEGQTYLGSGQTTTDATGFAAFDVTVAGAISPGDFVSATATDPQGNTSEFSQRLPFSVSPASGDPAGGAAITITGTDFADGAAVTIGGQPASNVVVVGPTQITAQVPALAPGTVNDLTVTNTDATAGTLPRAWVADFVDVPHNHVFNSYVGALVRNAITAGIGNGLYGVDQATLRQQMAVFLLKAKHGVCYVPPPCAGTFADVPCPSTFASWIEALAAEGITGGCGGGNYCPQNPVRRDQMAVFLLKAEHGSTYVPPQCAGAFDDVACPSQFADWIEQLAAEQITSGCGGGNYCPLNPNTRGQMAVFITKTFELQ